MAEQRPGDWAGVKGWRVLVAATQAGGTSAEFTLRNESWPVCIVSNTLGVGETVDLQMKLPDGSWQDVYSGGSQVQVTATNNPQPIFGPGTYRVVQSETAADTATWLMFKGAEPPEDAE